MGVGFCATRLAYARARNLRLNCLIFKSKIMTYHIMNSAMMPQPGTYEMEELPEAIFMAKIIIAEKNQKAVSSIGYPQNIEYIKEKTGVELPISRNATRLQPGDVMLIMRLKYRVDGLPKGHKVQEGDFEFFECRYQ
ncbi:MAG: DUF1874 domain-containing protein [Caulobacteraceae bacterium]|nr:DUF1874 domain-containing protein [Caulobacteraceae bacterium]